MSIKKWVTCGIACVFVAVTVAQNKAPAPRPTYDELMKKLELAEDRLAGMRDSLMKAQKEKTEAEKAVKAAQESADKEINELRKRVANLERLIEIAKEHGVDPEKIVAERAAAKAKADEEDREKREKDAALAERIKNELVTYDEYDRVKTGMTSTEVWAILGGYCDEVSRNTIADITTVMYVWKNKNGSNCNVMFQNGRVISKAQFGLP